MSGAGFPISRPAAYEPDPTAYDIFAYKPSEISDLSPNPTRLPINLRRLPINPKSVGKK